MKRQLFAAIIISIISLVCVSASEKIIIKANLNEGTISEINENPFILYFKLGKYYFEANELEMAKKAFLKSISLKEDFKESHYNLGVTYHYNGENDEAINEINRAIELDNNYQKAYYSLGLIYYGKKDYDNSIDNLKSAFEISESVNIAFDLGVVYGDRFRYKEGSIDDALWAIYYFDKAEQIEPGFAHALGNSEIIKEIIGI